MAAQRHPTLNEGHSPQTVTYGSGRQAWWLCKSCPCGHEHEWEASIRDRARSGTGCPFCMGRKPCRCSSLAALRTGIVQKEWDLYRNTRSPEDLLPQSNVKVHWRCSLHEPPHCWTAAPYQRFATKGSGCPACAIERRRKH